MCMDANDRNMRIKDCSGHVRARHRSDLVGGIGMFGGMLVCYRRKQRPIYKTENQKNRFPLRIRSVERVVIVSWLFPSIGIEQSE